MEMICFIIPAPEILSYEPISTATDMWWVISLTNSNNSKLWVEVGGASGGDVDSW